MLIVTSDPKIKALLEKGRKQRSDAFFGVLQRLWSIARPKVGAGSVERAAPKQRCPS